MTPSALLFPSNPFRVSAIDPRRREYRFSLECQTQSESVDLWLSQLKTGKASLLVAPHGTGKTTLLHSTHRWLASRDLPAELIGAPVRFHGRSLRAVAQRIRRRVAWTYAVLQRCIVSPRQVLLVDGFESVVTPFIAVWIIRCIASWRNTSVVLTCHRRLPWMHQLTIQPPSEELVRGLTISLISDSSLDQPGFASQHTASSLTPCSELPLPKTDGWIDVRRHWFELYERFQIS